MSERDIEVARTADGRPIIVPEEYYFRRWSEYARIGNPAVTYVTRADVDRLTARH